MRLQERFASRVVVLHPMTRGAASLTGPSRGATCGARKRSRPWFRPSHGRTRVDAARETGPMDGCAIGP